MVRLETTPINDGFIDFYVEIESYVFTRYSLGRTFKDGHPAVGNSLSSCSSIIVKIDLQTKRKKSDLYYYPRV